MMAKTCEEYVMQKLDEAENEVVNLKVQITELKAQLQLERKASEEKLRVMSTTLDAIKPHMHIAEISCGKYLTMDSDINAWGETEEAYNLIVNCLDLKQEEE